MPASFVPIDGDAWLIIAKKEQQALSARNEAISRARAIFEARKGMQDAKERAFERLVEIATVRASMARSAKDVDDERPRSRARS